MQEKGWTQGSEGNKKVPLGVVAQDKTNSKGDPGVVIGFHQITDAPKGKSQIHVIDIIGDPIGPQDDQKNNDGDQKSPSD